MIPSEFRQKIEENAFLEWEEVYPDKYYGTLKSEVDRMISEGKNVLLDIDVKGGINIKKIFGQKALSVFIQTPSIDILRKRLELRGTDSPEIINERLEKATWEQTFSSLFDIVIINDDLETAKKKCLEKVKKFIKIRTGLFGGSFNPIHEGHLGLADFVIENRFVEEVWFVVSPQNPLKTTSDPKDAQERLAAVIEALKNHPHAVASDIEFSMPVPSYSVDTLRHAETTFPDREFVIIIGGDNLDVFEKWKDYQYLLENNDILVPQKRSNKQSTTRMETGHHT